MNDNKIVLVPETNNSNITLNSCTLYEDVIEQAKCSGTLNTIDAYYIYINESNTNHKLYVYPEPTSINEVYDIEPNRLSISSSATTFTLVVDYIVNLNNEVLTLVDEYNSDNKVYLKKCSKENANNNITCIGTVTEAGYYYVYLNGLKQDTYVNAYSSFLTKALYIEPNVIKFESATKTEYIEIFFDSNNNQYQKSITLKGNNNNKAIVKYEIMIHLVPNLM